MFKNFRALSAFVGLVALFFVSVAALATCSDGSGSSDPSSSSRGSRPSVPSASTPPGVEFTLGEFEIGLWGNMDEYLDAVFTASITITGDTNYTSKFDSVLITLFDGSKTITLNQNRKTSEGRGYSWDSHYDVDGGRINVSGDEYCGRTFDLAYVAYAKGGVVVGSGVSNPVTRNEAKCRPPSAPSAESSSSAAVSKPLVSAGEFPKINQTTGINLSTMESTGVSNSDIYYDHGSAEIKVRNDYKIMYCFNVNGQCVEHWARASAEHGTENPTNTSQFVYYGGGGLQYTSADYMAVQYYLIKPSNSDEWGPGWFLIVSETRAMDAAAGLDIKVWKVN